jgi:hypothetical protein
MFHVPFFGFALGYTITDIREKQKGIKVKESH